MKKREIKTNSTNLKRGVYKREELELYGISKEGIEIVWQYQKQFPELLQDVDGFVIDARPLWEQLGEPYGQFNKWVENKMVKKGFINEVDYIVLDKKVQNLKGGRPTTEYSLTIDTAKNICMMENNEAGRLIRRYFIIVERAFRNRIEWNLDRDDTISLHTKLKQALIIHRQKLISHKNFPSFVNNNQFIAESCMLNEVVIGMSAKEYKQANGLGKNDAIRNYFTEEQLEYLAALQEYDADLINLQYMFDIEQRKEILTRKYKSM